MIGALCPTMRGRCERDQPLLGAVVLLVDDDDDSRDLTSYVLQLHGARVCAVRSAADASKALVAVAPDVLVSDVAMPEEDGLSLIRRVRAMSGNAKRIIAVALSSFATVSDRHRAIQAGFDAHLAKAASIQDLVGALRRTLDRHAARLSGRALFRLGSIADGTE